MVWVSFEYVLPHVRSHHRERSVPIFEECPDLSSPVRHGVAVHSGVGLFEVGEELLLSLNAISLLENLLIRKLSTLIVPETALLALQMLDPPLPLLM